MDEDKSNIHIYTQRLSLPLISEQNPTESTIYRSDEVLMGVLGPQHKDWWTEAQPHYSLRLISCFLVVPPHAAEKKCSSWSTLTKKKQVFVVSMNN